VADQRLSVSSTGALAAALPTSIHSRNNKRLCVSG
jgi:hypothetical protein